MPIPREQLVVSRDIDVFDGKSPRRPQRVELVGELFAEVAARLRIEGQARPAAHDADAAPPMAAAMRSAAAFGSAAAVMGRPITRYDAPRAIASAAVSVRA